MRKYRSTMLFLVLLLTLQTAAVPAGARTAAQSKDFSRTVEFGPGGELSLETDKGSVRVTAWDRNQVEIVARIDPPKEVDADYGRRAVEATTIEVTGDARSLRVRSNFDDVPYEGTFNRSRRLPDVHYEIRAPRRLNFSLNLDRSRAEVSGFEGRMNLTTDRTEVKAADLTGAFRLDMDRGELTLTNHKGSLDVDTDRSECRVESTRIEGDSRFDMDRSQLALRLPESQGLTLSARLQRMQNFDSDFNISSRQFSRDRIEGTINGGGPQLTIHAQRSGVSLKRL